MIDHAIHPEELRLGSIIVEEGDLEGVGRDGNILAEVTKQGLIISRYVLIWHFEGNLSSDAVCLPFPFEVKNASLENTKSCNYRWELVVKRVEPHDYLRLLSEFRDNTTSDCVSEMVRTAHVQFILGSDVDRVDIMESDRLIGGSDYICVLTLNEVVIKQNWLELVRN
jgi:hypothetical protein